MEQFLTWDILKTYSTFVTTVFMVVEFIKEIKYIKKIKTKYLSFVVSFVLMTVMNIVMGQFNFFDLFIYGLSSIAISLGANGLSNFNRKVSE